jgi:hypothetical protein
VQRICRAAKVPVVTAHGMRGLHGTLAVERGATTHVVAHALGPDQPRVLTVLAGGRSGASPSGNETKNFVTAEPRVEKKLP